MMFLFEKLIFRLCRNPLSHQSGARTHLAARAAQFQLDGEVQGASRRHSAHSAGAFRHRFVLFRAHLAGGKFGRGCAGGVSDCAFQGSPHAQGVRAHAPGNA